MLRFHRRRSASFQPPRAVRRKLWMYVGLLGLVYFLTTKAADPRTWFWIAPEPNGMQGPDGQLVENTLPPPRDVERPAGGFQAAADAPPAGAEPAPAAAERPRFPGLREDLLRDLRDDDFFRPREHAAFFHLLNLLRETDDATLAAASSGHVLFSQLFRQSESYRGEVVTVRGVARSCSLHAAPPNDYGIAEYYEVWLQPDDNPTYPMRVYALTVPPDFPTGEIGESIDVTGFFYRRIAYKAQDEPRTTPLVLGRGVDWRREESLAAGDEAATYFSAIAAVGTVLVIAAVFYLTRGKPLARRAAEAPERGSLNALRNVELAPGPATALRHMAEQMDRDEPVDAILRPPGGSRQEGR